MKWYYFIFMIMIIPFTIAYNIGDFVTIPAYYTVNGTYTHANLNISIYKNQSLVLDNKAMVEVSVGNYIYNYTFPNDVGKYDIVVNYYNDSWVLLGSASESYDVNNVSDIVDEHTNILEQIYDYVSDIWMNTFYVDTEIIGELKIYNQVRFDSVVSYDVQDCNLTVNTIVYDMNQDADRHFYYDYVLNDDGVYSWSVSCE